MESARQPAIWLRTILARNGLSVPDVALERLVSYVRELESANKRVNLVSRRDEENIWHHHILHSLSFLFHFQFPNPCRLLDLGSGGGLPGIPLKIMVPHVDVTMIDSTRKKVTAVENILTVLQMKGIRAAWGRAEELGRDPKFGGQFDVVVARAVGPLDEIARLARPFLRNSDTVIDTDVTAPPPMRLDRPCLVSYKGGALEAELEKTRRIRYVHSVKAKPIVFDGSEEMGLEEKKLVVVHFT